MNVCKHYGVQSSIVTRRYGNARGFGSGSVSVEWHRQVHSEKWLGGELVDHDAQCQQCYHENLEFLPKLSIIRLHV